MADAPGPHPVAVHVHYLPGSAARAAAVYGADLGFTSFVLDRVVQVGNVAPYEPGRLALRELPAIEAVLSGGPEPSLIVVDGYVDLDPQGRPGLGAHAHRAFGLPVIGVAKTRFRTATHARAVRRGGAGAPLYVTAAGRRVPAPNLPHTRRLPDAGTPRSVVHRR